MAVTPNMGLTTWPNLADVFSHTALANNLVALDEHDHTAAKGVKVGVGGLANLAVGSAQLQDNAVITSKLADGSVTSAKAASSLLLAVNPAGSSPYFQAYRSSAASYATGAAVIFNTEVDPNGWYNSATGIFLPTVAGTYRVSWALRANAAITVDKYWASVLNMGLLNVSGSISYQNTGTNGLVSVGSVLLPFNGTTDSARILADHENGGAVAINASRYTHFEAEYIGV